MAEEGAERADQAEGPGRPARLARAHGLAAILDQGDVPAGQDRLYRRVVVGVAQQIDREHHRDIVVDAGAQAVQIEIQGVGIDIHEAQPQAVLAQGIIGRGPGDGGDHGHLAGAQSRRLGVEQRRHGQQIGRGAGIDHHRIPRADRRREPRLEFAHLGTHGGSTALDHRHGGAPLGPVPGVHGEGMEDRDAGHRIRERSGAPPRAARSSRTISATRASKPISWRQPRTRSALPASPTRSPTSLGRK